MCSSDMHKTTFYTPYGIYEFDVRPFGLCEAPPTSVYLMDQAEYRGVPCALKEMHKAALALEYVFRSQKRAWLHHLS
jgi:hypothetical protein